MKTQCTRPSVRFQSLSGRELIATFDGGAITSDGGLPLLEQVDRRIGLLARVADCFTDRRAPGRIQHSVRDLVTQRVFALCAGHEDLSDHDSLRSDPLLRQLIGRGDSKELASSSTLNRLELSAEEVPKKERYKKITLDTDALDELFVELMIEDHKTEPAEIILDLDATDVLLHGEQEERFYHGYYRNYC